MRKFLFYSIVIFSLIILVVSLVYYEEKITVPTISVEIKGAVVNPGVYTVKANMIVEDIIKLSGGLLPNADVSILNRSRKLKNEMVIIIYTNDEIEEMRSGSTSVKYVDRECICPIIEKYHCIAELITNLDGVINLTGKISLNTGTIEEFITLPGIGAVRAADIIAYREANRGFRSVEEIMNVRGIGLATFERIKYYLTL